ncbi:MAG: ATP-binding protein [Gemmatimonadetes bacterium]|nr:ATP-binding protein [Gemmatimonadota bacterium]
MDGVRKLRLAARFFLVVAVVLVTAFLILVGTTSLDADGRRIGLWTLGGLLLVLYPAARLVTRSFEARLQGAQDAVARIGRGDPEPGVGRDSVSNLGRSIDRMAAELRQQLDDARRQSEDLRALFEGLDDGLALIDADGSVLLCNAAFEGWTGRTVNPGVRVGSLFRAPPVLEAVDQAQRGEFVLDEVTLGENTVLMSARPHRGGALLAIRDLTALRRLEGVRRDFVANVSHELKTPLTSVVGFAEAIAGGELAPDRAEDFGHRILANATRMRHLVDDLLDLAQVESGSWTPVPEPVSVGATAREVWETMAPDIGPSGETLVVTDAGVEAFADPDAVRQILRNLLDNAARYSEPGSAIRVDVVAEGLFLRTEVSDEGPGIPSVHLDRVFERFYRIDPARSRERGGTGLGLSIVKHLVEGQGGEVGIESELRRGTTVWFTLPVLADSLDESDLPDRYGSVATDSR